MSIKKPIVLEDDGVLAQLADGGIINAGGVSSSTFTVGGKGLLFDDGSSTSPGGIQGLTLQNAFDNSSTANNPAVIRLTAGKNLDIANSSGNVTYFSINSQNGNISLTGNIITNGLVDGVDVSSLSTSLTNHLNGTGQRHLAMDVDVVTISGIPADINNVQEVLEYLVANSSVGTSAEIDALELALGPSINTDGTFNQNGFLDVDNVLVNPSSVTDAIQQIANAFGSVTIGSGDVLGPGASTLNAIARFDSNTGKLITDSSVTIDNSGAIVAPSTGSIIPFYFQNQASLPSATSYEGAIALSDEDGRMFFAHNGTWKPLANSSEVPVATNFVQITGSTMTGNLILSNGAKVTGLPDPIENLDAVNKQYVDDTFVNVTGDNITGNLTFNGIAKVTGLPDPTQNSDAATKQYVDNNFLSTTGGTISGTVTFATGALLTGIATPINDTDAANKAYVDGILVGLSWKDAVRVATTANINLATAAQNGSTIDGITLVTGDRILIKDQTVKSQNGIYIVNASGSPTRASDLSLANEFDGAAVLVKQGTANESTAWTQTATVATVGSSDVIWSQFAQNGSKIGTDIQIGSPLTGDMTGAIELLSATSVSDGIAQLNEVLAKLIPPQPPNFPSTQSISIQSAVGPFRMTNFTQTDNTEVGDNNVAGGTSVSTVLRTSSYGTTTISNVGPGNKGTVSALVNGITSGSVTLTDALSAAGTYSNLIISNNVDYNSVNSAITAGFWSVFSARAAGTVSAGWNAVKITDTATASGTNSATWYYDSSTPGTPQFTSTSLTPPASPSLAYSSTIPHYTSSNSFTVAFNVNRLSGDMYPVSDTFMSGTARGAFSAPSSRTYAQASITTPLERNLYVSSGSAAVTTTASIVSGFGSSSQGPTVSVSNSYNTGTANIDPAGTVLYKTGTSSSMEETNVQVGSTIGTGSTAVARIINPGSTDTPVHTANATLFNSQTSTLQTSDATIVAGILKHDQTNYSTGYLPAGPDLSSGRSGSQYFTFKIVRASVSKFDVRWTGTLAGLWVSVPGSTIDSTSNINGWLDASVAYAGSGIPGANIGASGNGSNGCALGTPAPLNSAQTNRSITITFGTVSSSSTATNEIYVRIKLTAGQTITALSLQTASN